MFSLYKTSIDKVLSVCKLEQPKLAKTLAEKNYSYMSFTPDNGKESVNIMSYENTPVVFVCNGCSSAYLAALSDQNCHHYKIGVRFEKVENGQAVYFTCKECEDRTQISWSCPTCNKINFYQKNHGLEYHKSTYLFKDKGGCFIATACYGDYNAPEVLTLRQFRDQWLVNSFIGRTFVRCYYKLSPPVADFIATRENLKRIVRKWFISPLVIFINRRRQV